MRKSYTFKKHNRVRLKHGKTEMSCVLPPVCMFCQHFLEDDPAKECQAFAEIPDAIMSGKCDHTEPYPGDGGYRFRLIPTERETFLELNEIRREFKLPEFRLPD